MGGGSGPDGNFYANQDKLFGAQADIAQNLYNQYASYAPGYLNNSSQMVNEANSGALAGRARAQAGADSSQAFGNSMEASRRDMARYGTEFNADRMATRQQDAALTAAANKAGAMNSAGQWADDQRWNRNANAYGQIAGMGSGAMQGFGSAGAGYGQMAGAQQSSNAANAAGMGKFGSAIGTAMYKADGGYVEDRGLRFASGGPVPMAKVDWRSQATGGRRRNRVGAQVGQFALGIAPHAMAKYGRPMYEGARGMFGRDSAVQGNSTYDDAGYYSTGPSDPAYAEAPNYADASMQTYDDAGYYSTGPSDPDYAEATNYADSSDAVSTADAADYSMDSEMLADGGYVQRRGLRFARGGNVPPGVASSNPARTQAQSYRSGGRGLNAATGIRGGMAARSAARRFGGTSQSADVGTGEVSPDMTAAYDQHGTLGASGAEVGSAYTDTGATGATDSTGAAGAETSSTGADAATTGADATTAAEGTGGAAASEGTGAASSSTGSAAGYAAAAMSAYNNAQQARYYRNDRNGFGKHSPDYRHTVGSAILSYYLKGFGDAVADEIEPVMEPLTRGMIMTGDRIGGAGGALLTDPIGATVSGKYSGEELVKGAILGPAGKYLAKGGQAGRGLSLRKDFTPGGPVTGPGTDTSDNIPAWLSPREYVLNTEAVEIAGKENLDKLNERGLKIRARKQKAAAGKPEERPARRTKRKGA